MITDNGKNIPDETYVPDERIRRPPAIGAGLTTAYDRGWRDGARTTSIVWTLACLCVFAWGLFGRLR